MRGVPRSGLWSESSDFASGTGSERAKVASVAEGNPPRARVLPPQASPLRGYGSRSQASATGYVGVFVKWCNSVPYAPRRSLSGENGKAVVI